MSRPKVQRVFLQSLDRLGLRVAVRHPDGKGDGEFSEGLPRPDERIVVGKQRLPRGRDPADAVFGDDARILQRGARRRQAPGRCRLCGRKKCGSTSSGSDNSNSARKLPSRWIPSMNGVVLRHATTAIRGTMTIIHTM
ncbi:MAG: hypothetical protein V8Q54_00850 [Alistipes senegalensis]